MRFIIIAMLYYGNTTMNRHEAIEALENRVKELQKYEWEAKEAKDYPTCLHLYGAIIYFEQFIKELKEGDII